MAAFHQAPGEQATAAEEIAERAERIASLTETGARAVRQAVVAAQMVTSSSTGLRTASERFLLS